MALKTYSEQKLLLLGELSVQVQYQGQSKRWTLVVISGEVPALLGRDWMKELQLDWKHIITIASDGVEHC